MKFKSKICQECGKSFIPRSGTQRYCDGPHTAVCEYCGREFEYTCSPNEKPKFCSTSCRTEGKKCTVRNRYGVDNVSQLDEVKKKISHANSSDSVRHKRIETCLKNWGVNNVSKNDYIRAKISEIARSESYLKQREQTCIQKYGHKSPMQCTDVKAKRQATCIERYGITGHFPTESDLSKRIKDGSKVAEYLKFKENPSLYIKQNYDEQPTIARLEEDLGVTNTPIYDILIAKDCSDMIQRCYSSLENEVVEFLLILNPELQIKRNDRTVIKPLEIDIYLPDYNIGIECNPTATHNSSFGDPWTSEVKHYKYHQNKSYAAKRSGIFLFHIFGYEWVLNREIIKSMLSNLLHMNTLSYGGRGAYITNVTHIECKQFLNSNHRQGYTSSKVRLGLRLKSTNELISVMTFSHMRNTIGKTASSSENDWELSRFCSKLYTNVIGGASKLFKHFLKEFRPNQVISFSDIAHTKGDMYINLGFNQISESSPSYVWSNVYDTQYFHRVTCQKQYLRRLFKDDSIDIEHMTEKEIMESHGYARVFDSGVIKWIYTLDN